MSELIIVYSQPSHEDPNSNECHIIVPSDRALAPVSEGGYGMTIEQIAAKDVPAGCDYRITTRDKVPADRTFRNCWTDDFDTETVDVCMKKAKSQRMNEIREIRNKKLQGLDAEEIKAQSKALLNNDSADLAEVAAQKQTLRDLPQNIDLESISTPDELKAFIPDELK